MPTVADERCGREYRAGCALADSNGIYKLRIATPGAMYNQISVPGVDPIHPRRRNHGRDP